ncbi:MAG: XdhC/CoxI family protein [Myxococcota bacterium]
MTSITAPPELAAAGAEDVLAALVEWLEAGRRAQLVTVTRTWRSSPRPVGSHLAVRDDGLFLGSVSGGCVEGAVLRESLERMEAEDVTPPATFRFGTTDAQAWAVGLPCGGEIEVLVAQAPSLDALRALTRARRARRQAVLTLSLEDGSCCVMVDGAPAVGEPMPALLERFQAIVHREIAEVVSIDGVDVFVHPLLPRPRLAIVGAVHIAQALVVLAKMSDYDVVVVDPREAFNTAQRFPDTERVLEWPDDALPTLGLTARDALVVLSHDPKLDDPALAGALEEGVGYVGALGSVRNQTKRLERLAAAGVPCDELARIHGPVGLDIGSRSAPEIAVSIMAQLIQARKGKG